MSKSGKSPNCHLQTISLACKTQQSVIPIALIIYSKFIHHLAHSLNNLLVASHYIVTYFLG